MLAGVTGGGKVSPSTLQNGIVLGGGEGRASVIITEQI